MERGVYVIIVGNDMSSKWTTFCNNGQESCSDYTIDNAFLWTSNSFCGAEGGGREEY